VTVLPEYYTRTMAEIYAAQGYLDKAVQVYRHLLEAAPDRQDLRSALKRAQDRMAGDKTKQAEKEGFSNRTDEVEDVGVLLEEWIRLLLKTKTIINMQKFQNQASLQKS